MTAKYVLGIDLGTTNSVLAFAPLGVENAAVQTLPIPQLVGPSAVESRPMLPSFLYLAAEHERASGVYDLAVGKGPRLTQWASWLASRRPMFRRGPSSPPNRGFAIAASIAISRSCRSDAPAEVAEDFAGGGVAPVSAAPGCRMGGGISRCAGRRTASRVDRAGFVRRQCAAN